LLENRADPSGSSVPNLFFPGISSVPTTGCGFFGFLDFAFSRWYSVG